MRTAFCSPGAIDSAAAIGGFRTRGGNPRILLATSSLMRWLVFGGPRGERTTTGPALWAAGSLVIRHRVCMAGWGKGRGHGHPEHTLTGMGDNMRGAGPHNGVGGRAYPSIANGNQTRDALRSAGSRNDPARRGRVTETLCTRSYKKETAATPEVQPSAPSEKSS